MRSAAFLLSTLFLAGAASGCKCSAEGGFGGALPSVAVPVGDDGVDELERNSLYSIDFGHVRIGHEEHRSFEIRNTGLAPLEVGDLSIEGPAASAYGARSPDPRIAPNTAGWIEIAFEPLEEGVASALLLIDTNDPDAPTIAVELNGVGYHPAITVSPSSLDFGPVVVEDSATLPLELKNVSTEPLEVTVRPMLPRGMSSTYTVGSIAAGDGELLFMQAGQSVELRVTYAPRTTGRHEAVLPIQPCPACEVEKVSLFGTAIDSALLVEPTDIRFGKVRPGHTVTMQARFMNVGGSAVEVEYLGLADLVEGDAHPAFELHDIEVPFTVEPGATVPVGIDFTPPDANVRAAYLEWTSSDRRNQEGRVLLTGTGGGPAIELTPREISFGRVPVGSTVDRRLVISNPGDETLTLSSIGLGGTVDGFVLNTPVRLPLEIEAGELLALDLSFRPPGEGEKQGSLIVISDARHEPSARADLAGTGIEPGPCEHEALPRTLSFGNIRLNELVTMPLFIENVGNEPCVLRDLGLGTDTAPEFSLISGAADPILLFPTEVHKIEVSFHPQASGSYGGAVRFEPSNPDSAEGVIPLQGRSMQPSLALEPVALDFGVVDSSCPIRWRRFCVLNLGSVPADITEMEISGAGGDQAFDLFEDVHSVDGVVAVVEPGDRSCFNVIFEPPLAGAYMETMAIHVADAEEPLALPMFGAASDQGGDGGTEGHGCLHGRICGPTGDTWLWNATVTVPLSEDESAPQGDLSTTTDRDGFFLLEGIPAGNRQVIVEKGSFANRFRVHIYDAGVTRLPEPKCVRGDSARIAVVIGAHDSVHEVLARAGATNVTYFVDPSSLLGELWRLESYDIVFINCGACVAPAGDALIRDSIRAFVHGGGSLYVSDWAFPYIDEVWPGRASFLGVGSPGSIIGTVLDTLLIAHLGKQHVDLTFDLDGWVVAGSTDPSVERVVIGDVPGAPVIEDAPLLFYFQHGAGRVLFTSFHNDTQTTEDVDAILEHLVFRL